MKARVPELSAEAVELKDQGNKYFAKGSYKSAIDIYERALALAPGNPVLLSNLAASELGLKQWSQALRHADECLAADPSFTKAYGRKAAAQLGLIRPGDAERTLLTGLARDPGNAFLQGELRKLREKDDGDQSPCRARDGSDRELREMQARVSVTMTPYAPWPNRTFVAAFLGDEESFMQSFCPEDLRLRALEARLPLTTVVVAGAQRIRGTHQGPPQLRAPSDSMRGTQHTRVMRQLLDAGARPDSKDASGWTALHHATAHHVCLDLAQMLLEAGADVNLQDRLGTYPLMSAIMSYEVKSVKLLLAHGARADVKDNDGVDAISMSSCNSEIQALVHNAQYKNKRPGREKVCAACGKPGTKACGGCGGSVSYCSRECQKAHWPEHMSECHPAAKSTASPAAASAAAPTPAPVPRELRLRISPNDGKHMALTNMQGLNSARMANLVGVAPPEAKRADPHTSFVGVDPNDVDRRLAAAARKATREKAMKVKIQVPMAMQEMFGDEVDLPGAADEPTEMLCYNQDRSFVCQLEGNTPAGRQLVALIRQQGILGLKGYFVAFFDDECKDQNGVPKEVVLVTSMLPAQPF